MASSNPYQVLGVPQDAHDDAIKAAYRKQSLLYHPDKHPDDTTAATERMKKINEAYESLKPENRTATDEVLGKTSSPRAQAPGHQRQWSGSPFAQRAGSHRAGDDFWWQNRYYGQQRRQHQQEQAKRERERSARAWREAEEQAERDRRAQQARERKRQREQEKIKRYWEERRERREREAREREEAERVRREEAERRRREEEEEAARKHQEKADRIREVREQSQRAFRAMEERDYQKKRAAEEEVRKRLIERELARQRWEREQRQSAQFVELYQRHDTVYNEWLQLEAEYNNLLPLVRLDLSGPDPLARYISRSVLDTEDAVGSQAHPYRTEWITWMDHFRGAWPNIYLFDAQAGGLNARQQHKHSKKQKKRCHYFNNEAANIAIAKAMHRDIRRRVEVFNLSPWDGRVVREVAREWAPEFQVGKCKARRSRSPGRLVLTRQLEVQLAMALRYRTDVKES